MNRVSEMVEWVFPQVVRACRKAVLPRLRDKGITIVSRGADFGEIVTDMDLGASALLLDGGEGNEGLRNRLPGSFSEESDSLQRMGAVVLYENDPCDGTGDAVATRDTGAIVGPTNLTARLERPTADSRFTPIVGMIYDVLGEYAIIGGEGRVLLGRANEAGGFVPVRFYRVQETIAASRQPTRIGIRRAYPQTNAHVRFPAFLGLGGVGIEQIPVGGAGTQALQFFRSRIVPVNSADLPAFARLEPIDAIVNAQPDWKTWDTDPTLAIAGVLGLPDATDLFGEALRENAAASAMSDMHHRSGFVLAYDANLRDFFTGKAREFRDAYPELNLLKKDY